MAFDHRPFLSLAKARHMAKLWVSRARVYNPPQKGAVNIFNNNIIYSDLQKTQSPLHFTLLNEEPQNGLKLYPLKAYGFKLNWICFQAGDDKWTIYLLDFIITLAAKQSRSKNPNLVGLLQQTFIFHSGYMSGASGQVHLSAHLGPRDEGGNCYLRHAHAQSRGEGKQEAEFHSAISWRFLQGAYFPPPGLLLVNASHRASLTLGEGCLSPGEELQATGHCAEAITLL